MCMCQLPQAAVGGQSVVAVTAGLGRSSDVRWRYASAGSKNLHVHNCERQHFASEGGTKGRRRRLAGQRPDALVRTASAFGLEGAFDDIKARVHEVNRT